MQSYNFLSVTNICAVLLPSNMNVYTLHGNPLLDTTVHSRITIGSTFHVSRPSHLLSSAPHDHLRSWTSPVPSAQMFLTQTKSVLTRIPQKLFAYISLYSARSSLHLFQLQVEIPTTINCPLVRP
jgi:hypothetical protein